jgi:hypothetical protein
MTATRAIETDDLDSAARGLGMRRACDAALRGMVRDHGGDDRMFASRVIVAAAVRELERRVAAVESLATYVVQRRVVAPKRQDQRGRRLSREIGWRSIPEHHGSSTAAHWRKRTLEAQEPGEVFRVLEILNPRS